MRWRVGIHLAEGERIHRLTEAACIHCPAGAAGCIRPKETAEAGCIRWMAEEVGYTRPTEVVEEGCIRQMAVAEGLPPLVARGPQQVETEPAWVLLLLFRLRQTAVERPTFVSSLRGRRRG